MELILVNILFIVAVTSSVVFLGAQETESSPEFQNKRSKLNALLDAVRRSATELEKVADELDEEIDRKSVYLHNLEAQVGNARRAEKDLRSRIETLKSFDPPMVEYFMELSKPIEKQNKLFNIQLAAIGAAVGCGFNVLLVLLGLC